MIEVIRQVVRGGSWFPLCYLRASYRLRQEPLTQHLNLGFRLVVRIKDEYRVLRGGSWIHDTNVLRASRRNGDEPVYRFNFDGFRLVVRIKDE